MSAEDCDDLPAGVTVVPTLINCCLRVISSNINAIESLGNMPYTLVKPILEDKRCTAEILRKIEENSPHLKRDDQEIWRKLCFDEYSECRDKYTLGELDHVKSWRKFYTQCRLDRQEKLNYAANRMREKRERDHAEKRGRQLVVTDKLPPPKRSKLGGWGGGPSKPKTLMEKARNQTKKATSVYRGPSASTPSPSSSGSGQRTLPRFSPPTPGAIPFSFSPSSVNALPQDTLLTRQSSNRIYNQLVRQHITTLSSNDVPSTNTAIDPLSGNMLRSAQPNGIQHSSISLSRSNTLKDFSDLSSLSPALSTSMADVFISRASAR